MESIKMKFKVQMSSVDGVHTRTVKYPFQHARNNKYNPYEYICAMQDIEHEITALKVGDNMYFQPLRDIPSKGIITRVR